MYVCMYVCMYTYAGITNPNTIRTIIEKLMKRKLIKDFTSVHTGKKKMYILAGLEPSKELTGKIFLFSYFLRFLNPHYALRYTKLCYEAFYKCVCVCVCVCTYIYIYCMQYMI